MTADGVEVGAPRYVVTGGGTPTAEQLAALAVAMTPVAVAAEADLSVPPAGQPSAWARAAILEGIGHRTFVARPDLAAGRFPLR